MVCCAGGLKFLMKRRGERVDRGDVLFRSASHFESWRYERRRAAALLHSQVPAESQLRAGLPAPQCPSLSQERLNEPLLGVFQTGVRGIEILNFFAQIAKQVCALGGAADDQQKLGVVPRLFQVLKQT